MISAVGMLRHQPEKLYRTRLIIVCKTTRITDIVAINPGSVNVSRIVHLLNGLIILKWLVLSLATFNEETNSVDV